jgi:hypothetical protein
MDVHAFVWHSLFSLYCAVAFTPTEGGSLPTPSIRKQLESSFVCIVPAVLRAIRPVSLHDEPDRNKIGFVYSHTRQQECGTVNVGKFSARKRRRDES